jgi:regulator of replication initiation timing
MMTTRIRLTFSEVKQLYRTSRMVLGQKDFNSLRHAVQYHLLLMENASLRIEINQLRLRLEAEKRRSPTVF